MHYRAHYLKKKGFTIPAEQERLTKRVGRGFRNFRVVRCEVRMANE